MKNKESLPILKQYEGIGLPYDVTDRDYTMCDYKIRWDIYEKFIEWARKHDEDLKARNT